MSIDIQEEYDKIHRYCYYKVGNSALAEDLTQETFLKYFAQNSYIEHGKKLAYLYTIARNLCIDTFRKPQTEALSDDITDTDVIERLELNITVREALSTLPMKEQELLLLRYANQLSVGEIASIMGISRFSVYRTINSALASLKVLLKEDFL
ncbi:MAG: hypothetical protein K0S04_3206 [Herbinix sp.]|nr:hypothetical protein [Herbinix sp.]